MNVNVKVAFALLKYGLPVIILLGTVGNILSFVVLIRRSMRSTPMYFYLTLLAVADTMVLFTSAFKTWIRVLTGYEALHVSDVGCKVITFLLLNSLYLSAWLIVLVTLDRFLVVWFPLHGYLVMRIKRARVCAVLLTVVVGLYNGHVFWTFSLSRPADDDDERVTEEPPKCLSMDTFFMQHVFEYLKLVSYCAVPFAIVLALNVGIIYKINRAFSQTPATTGKNSVELIPMNQPAASASPAPSPSPLETQEVVIFAATSQQTKMRWEKSQVRNLAHAQYYRYSVQAQQQQLQQQQRKAGQNVHMPIRTLSMSANQSDKTAASNVTVCVQDIRQQRQRRLTRMLLFISFTWLILTAPFTLHSLMPEPRAPQSDSTSERETRQFRQTTYSYSSGYTESASPFLDRQISSILSRDVQSAHYAVSGEPNVTAVGHTMTTLFAFSHDISEGDQPSVRYQPLAATEPSAQQRLIADQIQNEANQSKHDASRLFLIKTICFLLIYINHASNFYLYCVTGGKFRYELSAMLTTCSHWFRRRLSCHCNRRELNASLSTATVVHPAIDDGVSIRMVQCADTAGGRHDAGGNSDRTGGNRASSSHSGSSTSRAHVVGGSTESKKITRQNMDELYN